VLARITHEHVGDEGAGELEEPGGVGALLERQVDLTAEAAQERADALGVRGEDGLGDQMAARIADARRDRCFVDVEANILALRHRGCSFRTKVGGLVTALTLLPRGATLYCVTWDLKWASRGVSAVAAGSRWRRTECRPKAIR